MTKRRWHMINLAIFLSMIVVPLMVMASVPTTTSFDRHNVYRLDGYRDGGYYVERHNPATTGYMNMSHIGGTNEFTIEAYNIKNITLDMDLMFERRKSLFGWDNVSWEEMVSALGGEIVININTTDPIEELRFVDNPDVRVQVKKDGLVYQPWGRLGDVEIEADPVDSGVTVVVLQFDQVTSLYDLLYSLLVIVIILGLGVLLARYIHRALFFDGRYYKEWGRM